jgi:hypothetical protein
MIALRAKWIIGEMIMKSKWFGLLEICFRYVDLENLKSPILGKFLPSLTEFYAGWTQEELMQRHRRYGGVLDE